MPFIPVTVRAAAEETGGAFEVFVPRGTRHGFSGKVGSRFLVVAIPGGLEGFFEELGAGLAAGRTDADMRAALAGKYDSYPEVR